MVFVWFLNGFSNMLAYLVTCSTLCKCKCGVVVARVLDDLDMFLELFWYGLTCCLYLLNGGIVLGSR